MVVLATFSQIKSVLPYYMLVIQQKEICKIQRYFKKRIKEKKWNCGLGRNIFAKHTKRFKIILKKFIFD